MAKQTRPRFNPEFNVESAKLALDQEYSVRETAEAMGQYFGRGNILDSHS